MTDPIGMSVPAPSRDNSTASAACSTMNMVTPCSRASASQRAVQLGRDLPRHGDALVAGRRRARPVGRQRQLLRRPGQRLPPVADLPRQQAVRVVLGTEQLPLPQRVIGVLHRQLRPPGAVPARRAAYATAMSRPSGASDQPSQAM